MRKLAALALALSSVVSCTQKASAPTDRVELRKLSGNTIELVPNLDHPGYCLVFTQSEKGITRQLTMNRRNESVPCTSGRSIGGVSYRIPVEEGRVDVHIFLSDKPLNAGSISQQILDLGPQTHWRAMDLRLPGRVATQSLSFLPEVEAPATLGAVVAGPDAGTGDAPDAGQTPSLR